MLISVVIAAVVAQAAPAQDAGTTVTVPAPERLICQRQDRTGTRMKRTKICLTQRQWDARRDEERGADSWRFNDASDAFEVPEDKAAPKPKK